MRSCEDEEDVEKRCIFDDYISSSIETSAFKPSPFDVLYSILCIQSSAFDPLQLPIRLVGRSISKSKRLCSLQNTS